MATSAGQSGLSQQQASQPVNQPHQWRPVQLQPPGQQRQPAQAGPPPQNPQFPAQQQTGQSQRAQFPPNQAPSGQSATLQPQAPTTQPTAASLRPQFQMTLPAPMQPKVESTQPSTAAAAAGNSCYMPAQPTQPGTEGENSVYRRTARSPPPAPPPPADSLAPPPAVTAAATPGKSQFFVEIDWEQNRALGIRLTQRSGQVLVSRLEAGSLGDECLKVGDRVLAIDTVGVTDVRHAKLSMAQYRGGRLRIWVEREGPAPVLRTLARPPHPGDVAILPPDVLRIVQHARHDRRRSLRVGADPPKPILYTAPPPAKAAPTALSVNEKPREEVPIACDLPPEAIPMLKKCKPLGVI